MIIALRPAVRFSLLLLLLSGCGPLGRRYEVGEPPHVYFPPSASDITPTRLATGAIENGGFAFRVCDGADHKKCDVRLKNVSSAGVSTPSGREHAYKDAYIGQLMRSSPREFPSNPALNRFLVRGGVGKYGVPENRYIFHAVDETMIAICTGEWCTRFFRKDGLAIRYSFKTSEKFAGDVAPVDEALLEAIRGLRCDELPKSP